MSKESYRNRIAALRSQIVSKQEFLRKSREEKKKKMATFSNSIKNASSQSAKAALRKQKLVEQISYDNRIDTYKRAIEGLRQQVLSNRESMARL